MNPEYTAMVQSLHECSACSFRCPDILPLAPELPAALPVPIMFIGENPSWAKGQDSPLDGSTISGGALEANYLAPLGLTRRDVWITDLFKCRYPKSVYRAKRQNEELIQSVANVCASSWLLREIALARPRVLVTLSDKQVYQRLRQAFDLSTPGIFTEAVGKPYPITLGGQALLLFPMIHPDISRPVDQDRRKSATRAKWAPLHKEQHIETLRTLL